MIWPNGVRTLKKYNSTSESFQDFYELWKRKYKRFPTYEDAVKWTGNDRADNWIRIVTETYPKYL